MSFKSQDLSVLSYANNFTMWHYKTTDELTVVKAPGYFNNAQSMLRQNDLIILNTHDQNTSVWVGPVGTTVRVTESTETQ